MSFVVLSLFGCGGGGGGGGGTGTAVGRIINVQTGEPPNPQATVSLGGGAGVLTSSVDGSFSATGPAGSTQLSVNTVTFGIKNFTVPPVIGTAAVGDFYIGPEEVTLRGRVISGTDQSVVSGATVSFGGRTGTTNSQGIFQLSNVAYSSTNQSVFWGIVGTIRKAGFVTTSFSASPFVASAGVVDIGDVLITSLTDPNPPPPPYNIYGKVRAGVNVSGTVVTLKQSGTPVRIVNVGQDGNYFFWVGVGTYTISYQLGNLSAPDQNATLTQPNQVIHIPDVTLH